MCAGKNNIREGEPHGSRASVVTCEGTFARRVPGTPGTPSIQMNVPAIYHNALPPNITPSSSLGTLSTSTLYDCWQSNSFPFFRPTNGTITCTLPLWAPSWPPTSKSKNPPHVRDGPLKWPHQRVGVLNTNLRGHTKVWENFARRARRVPGAPTYSLWCHQKQASIECCWLVCSPVWHLSGSHMGGCVGLCVHACVSMRMRVVVVVLQFLQGMHR